MRLGWGKEERLGRKGGEIWFCSEKWLNASKAASFWDNFTVRDGVDEVKGMELTLTIVKKRGVCGGPSLVVSYDGKLHDFFWHNSWSLVLYIAEEKNEDDEFKLKYYSV